MNFRYALLLIITMFSFSAMAQKGILQGQVKDKATGEEIIGANVSIAGTSTGTSSDITGNFQFQAPAGTHTIKATFIGYKPLQIPAVVVKAGQATSLEILLESEDTQLNEVTVIARAETASEISVVKAVRESKQVVNAIGQQQIQKQGDGNAAQVAKRIPGVTLVDGRFIMVRGLHPRYNAVTLNGLSAPSTEPNARIFSFDVLPSSAIDRMMVYKSGAAEFQGEFAGAVINTYTRNTVDENYNKISLSFGYRDGTTGQNFVQDADLKGAGDFFGFGTGKRDWTKDIMSADDLKGASLVQQGEQAKKLRNTWAHKNVTALPDMSLGYQMGRKFSLGKVMVNTLNNVSFGRSYTTTYGDRFAYWNYQRQDGNTEGKVVSSSQQLYNDDTQFEQTSKLSALSNWSFQLSDKHSIDFRNLYTRISESQVFYRHQQHYADAIERVNTSTDYLSRSILSSQLQGNHRLNADRTRLSWVLGYSYIDRQEPDTRRSRAQRALGTEDQLLVQVQPQPTIDVGARFRSDLKEYIVSQRADVEHVFGESFDDKNAISLKAGYYVELNKRDFAARWISYTTSNNTDYGMIAGTSPEQVFAPGNMGYQNGGLILKEGTNPTDAYTAQNFLTAGYASVNMPLFDRFNLQAGLRVEHNIQQLDASTQSGAPLSVKNPITSLLPFGNLAYNFSDRALLRLAYSRTLNRPAFRELAPFAYYDFEWRADVVGNPNLKISTVDNVDLRWEFYPSKSESISLGAFYKKFKNPIERYYRVGASNPIFTFENADAATAAGVEIELRKSLDNLTANRFLQNISLMVNASLIHSSIELGDKSNEVSKTRAMQGQSPYIVNAGIFYDNPDNGLSVNLLYNVYGARIYAVGDGVNTFPWYEMPRNLLDLNVSKDFGKGLSLNFSAQNLLNARNLIREDQNVDGKLTSDVDKKVLSSQNGATFTLGLGWKF